MDLTARRPEGAAAACCRSCCLAVRRPAARASDSASAACPRDSRACDADRCSGHTSGTAAAAAAAAASSPSSSCSTERAACRASTCRGAAPAALEGRSVELNRPLPCLSPRLRSARCSLRRRGTGETGEGSVAC